MTEQEAKQKIEYYVNLFENKGITLETSKEFENDRSMCSMGSLTMPCSFCSHGCFKVNVYRYLKKEFFEKLLDLQLKSRNTD